MDPSAVLGVSCWADENTVRQRYLDLVHEHPPDTDPKGFTEIHAAYTELMDPVARWDRALFDKRDLQELDEIISHVRRRDLESSVSCETLLNLGSTYAFVP